ncbi:hypothetical protein YC2023_016377 [Brassica napus]
MKTSRDIYGQGDKSLEENFMKLDHDLNVVSEPDPRSPTRSTSIWPKVGPSTLAEHFEIDAQRTMRIRHKVSRIGSWKGS